MKNHNKHYFLTIISLAISMLFSFQVHAANSQFGITAEKVKVGDTNAGNTYGPGYHNMVIDESEVYIAYSTRTNYNTYEVRIGMSHDAGMTWENSVLVTYGASFVDWAGVAVGLDPISGTKLTHVSWGDSSTHSIMYSNSSNFGNQINVSGSIQAETYGGNIVTDGGNNVFITFTGRDAGGQSGIWFNSSSDGGVTFSTEPSLAINNAGFTLTSLAADNLGNVFVAYYANNSVLFSRKLAGSSTWSMPVVVNGNISPDYPSIAVKDVNNIYIAFKGYVARTTNGGANGPSDWTQYSVYNGGSATPSVSVNATGIIGIAWGGSVNGVYYSKSTNGGTQWTAPTMAAATTGNSEPHVAIDGSGKACILISPTDKPVYFTREK